MKKNAIALICLLSAIAGLLAALILLRRTELSQPPVTNPSCALPDVYKLDAPVRSIHIRQAGKTPFTLQNLAQTAGDDIKSTLLGREGLPADVLRINGILRAAASLSYTELLFEDFDGDGALFGLAPPRAVVEITDMNSQSVVLNIGDAAPGNIGVYLELERALYLVPVYLLDAYLLPEPDFLSHTVTAPSPAMDFSRVILGGRVL